MPDKAQSEQFQAVLVVGEASGTLLAGLEALRAGVRSVPVADVYGAAAHLLKAAGNTAIRLPAAILVLVESLRGDELRFFDVLARRWPAMAVAAVYDSSEQDRRLDVCRRKGVAIVPISDVVGWVGRCVVDRDLPAAPPSAPVNREVFAEYAGEEGPPLKTEADDFSGESQGQDASDLSIHELPEESFVDLPDELISQFPDHLDEELPEEAPAWDEPSQAMLDNELPEVHDDAEELPPAIDEAGEDQSGEDHLGQRHLTPWSQELRPERQRPVRKPPGARRSEAGEQKDSDQVAGVEGEIEAGEADVTAQEEAEPGEARTSASPPPVVRTHIDQSTLPDYGLLTPDELRALLQDPEDLGGQP